MNTKAVALVVVSAAAMAASQPAAAAIVDGHSAITIDALGRPSLDGRNVAERFSAKDLAAVKLAAGNGCCNATNCCTKPPAVAV